MGCVIKARAITILWRCPPENSCGYLYANCFNNPTSSKLLYIVVLVKRFLISLNLYHLVKQFKYGLIFRFLTHKSYLEIPKNTYILLKSLFKYLDSISKALILFNLSFTFDL
ncbi:hypothetical protein NWE61_04035 [Mycoplasmopsis felis]|nr:hypothetical protein [Mycoplasmopsis felis]MCU9934297.1 hypothetical protein [Mycoplasmopsis felis]